MNLSWIDDFNALAATGNFSRAAEERHMTQPAFSRRIRALEEWLGAELFDRSSQPARVTEVGEWFRAAAQDLQARVATIPGEARAVAEATSSTLRFASTHALSFTFLPKWLRALEAHAAMGPIQLVSDVQQKCEGLLMQSQVHFVLTHAHPGVRGELDDANFPSLLVGADQLLPVSAPDDQGRPLNRLDSDHHRCRAPDARLQPGIWIGPYLEIPQGTRHRSSSSSSAHPDRSPCVCVADDGHRRSGSGLATQIAGG